MTPIRSAVSTVAVESMHALSSIPSVSHSAVCRLRYHAGARALRKRSRKISTAL